MPKSFTLKIHNHETGADISAPVSIADDDWQTLLNFAGYAEQLLESEIVPSVLQTKFALSMTKETGLTFKADTMPSDDVVHLLLHRARPFVLQEKEPTSFFRVCGILDRYMTVPELRSLVDRHRAVFSARHFQQQMKIETTTPELKGVVNLEQSFHKWLNGFEYHRFPEQRDEIQELCGMLPFEFVRAVFICMLIDKLKAILNLAVFIRWCERGHGQTLTVQ